MTGLPHDLDDLRLAPVLLHLEDRLVELGALEGDDLRLRIAFDSDRPDWDEERRRSALMTSIVRDVEMGGWETTWEERGLGMRHGVHHVVLGLPRSLVDYIAAGSGSPKK